MATNENLIPVPGRLHSVASEGHVAGADEIYDDNKSKLQSAINADVDSAIGSDSTEGSIKGRIKSLETLVGSDSVSTQINSKINELDATKSQTAGSDGLGLSITEVDGKITSISGSIEPGTYATLENGKVPSSQLPAFVDDVIEGYLYNGKFWEEAAHTTEITPEAGKIYTDLVSNLTYRWGGSAYVEISQSLGLGETSSTAFPGDRGVALENAVGQGGSVDTRIAAAKSEVIGGATSNGNTLKKLEDRVSSAEADLASGGSVDTRISNAVSEEATARANAVNTETTRAQAAEQQLQEQYNALTQSDIIVGSLPASGTKNLIFRVPGTTSYSDYMWNGSNFVKMAEYDNATDDVPTAGSNNLVKSKGVFVSQAGVFGIPSSPQGFLRRVDLVGNTKFSVDKWLDYGITDYTLELCFRYKGSDSTKFLLSWQESGGSAYALRVLADNKMDIAFPSALNGTLYTSNYVNKDVRLTLKRTEQAVMVYVNGNLATVTSYTPASGSVSEVYLGSWITGQVGYVTDYYYLRLIDNITGDVVKQINVGSDFEELSMERHTLGRIFKNASSGSGSELTDGDVILTGEITLNSTVTLDANTHIRGNDCIVHVGANGKLIMGEGCSIDGVVFDGGLAYTRTKKEGANYYNLVPLISVSDIPNYATYIGDEVISILGENATITNCRFDNIDRLCIKYNDNNQAYLVKTQPNIINNYFFNCRAGILYQGEFGRIIGNVFNSVVYGSIHSHGNLTMSSCIYMRCDVGQLIVGGGNPGHSEFSALEFAHNGIAGLYVLSLPRTVGNVYSGCQWADAPIIGENCNALLITGSRLDCWVEIAAGNANAFIANNVYKNYATRDNKPIFGGQVTYNLKVNNAAGANVTDSEINN